MTLLVVGANHRSAGTEVLELLAAQDPAGLAMDAISAANVAESLVVSTCNRVEIYAEVSRFHAAVDDIVATLAKSSGLTVEELTAACYVHYDERAVQHLFEVAAGLDSMVVGEPQILGQVRSALAEAQELGTAGRELNELGQVALRVGKSVRSQTGLERAGASVVTVGMAEAFQRLSGMGGPQPRDANLVILGAGAMSSLAIAHGSRLGVAGMAVVNRTPDRAHRLARDYGGRGAGIDELGAMLETADVVVCCTGALGLVLHRAEAAAAMEARPDRPLVVLDLALPHDSDPAIAYLHNVARVDLMSLAERPEAHADRADIQAARIMVADELTAHVSGRAARAVEPVLVSLRSRGSDVVEAELGRLRERLPGLDAAQWSLIEQAMRRTVNTLMHTPTVRIKELATDPEGRRYADALTSLFDLSVDLVEQMVLPRDPDREPEVEGL
jgi:glutamyl-tRNA reductase